METFSLTVGGAPVPRRLDAYLARELAGRVSREVIKRAIARGDVRLNGKTARPSAAVMPGDTVTGTVASGGPSALEPESRELDVLYEDKDLLVLNKPAGLVVHPGAGNRKGTLAHALVGRLSAGRQGALSSLGGPERPGIVHRLDKETSGVLVVAKTDAAHRELQRQFQAHEVKKTYVALVKGRMEYEEGHVSAALARHPKVREKRAVSASADAKEALTAYRVLKRFKHATLVELTPQTGRTHQLRVHLAHLGHPVVGDPLYGSRGAHARHALHAERIELVHPRTGTIMKFTAEWPADLRAMVESAEKTP